MQCRFGIPFVVEESSPTSFVHWPLEARPLGVRSFIRMTNEQSSGYSPRQSDVVYEKVSPTEFDKCSGKIEKRGGSMGIWFATPTNSLCDGSRIRTATEMSINGATFRMASRCIGISIRTSMERRMSIDGWARLVCVGGSTRTKTGRLIVGR